tara:strand:+ start:22063 stop:23064 length:1002 start_codon:yes stop_codon:yes gene_type:complete
MRVLKTLLLFSLISLVTSYSVFGQEDSRPITIEEYNLAKTFVIEDLDNETYVKFENKYILDRYELRKPIYITGDDGLKKRVDLYKLIVREGLMDLGVMVFYTNEIGTLYNALVPNFTASGEVWEMYFEDIHAIDKEEANFVLKLSYVLSREFSFQMFKNNSEGEISDEHATYGSDICFPGDQLVSLADGSSKLLREVKMGDKVITIDPETRESKIVEVNKLVSHAPENYAITVLTLLKEDRFESESFVEINLSVKELKATPNHPMLTQSGNIEIGEVNVGEVILSWNQMAKKYDTYTVYSTKEIVEGVQPVYSIEASEGTTLIMNGVMVKQKN